MLFRSSLTSATPSMASWSLLSRTLPSHSMLSLASARRLASSSAAAAASKRPVSPHVTIYQPQLTWVMSIVHRVTGAGLATGVYGASIWYAMAPYSSATIVGALASMPGVVTFLGKVVFAAPFTYHTFNGIRHLLWDATYALSLKGVYNTGYAVQAATVVSTLALAAM